jgi:hypothetical protein
MVIFYFLKLIAQYFLFIYVIIIVLLYYFQRKLIYKPTKKRNNKVTFPPLPENTKRITIQSKYPLQAWFLTKSPSFFTILFLHGNSGLLEDRIYKLVKLEKLNVNILMISYRGFQGNLGNPSECGLYEDALASKKWLMKNGIGSNQIVLYGESLGTAVAVHLALHDPRCAGVILESPFTSMLDMANLSYKFFLPSLFLQDKFNTIDKVDKIKCPILIMHGKQDSLVPFEMGKSVFRRAKCPKFFYENDDEHMMKFKKDVINVISKFLDHLY